MAMHSSVSTAMTSTPRLDQALATPGSWSREAQSTLTLARERGLCLSDERLIYSDVRDLVTLQRLLRRVDPAASAPGDLQAYLCA